MKEYKIIHKKFSWSKSTKKFEDDINNYAKHGWRVVNIYSSQNGYVEALLEKDKNR